MSQSSQGRQENTGISFEVQQMLDEVARVYPSLPGSVKERFLNACGISHISRRRYRRGQAVVGGRPGQREFDLLHPVTPRVFRPSIPAMAEMFAALEDLRTQIFNERLPQTPRMHKLLSEVSMHLDDEGTTSAPEWVTSMLLEPIRRITMMVRGVHTEAAFVSTPKDQRETRYAGYSLHENPQGPLEDIIEHHQVYLDQQRARRTQTAEIQNSEATADGESAKAEAETPGGGSGTRTQTDAADAPGMEGAADSGHIPAVEPGASDQNRAVDAEVSDQAQDDDSGASAEAQSDESVPSAQEAAEVPTSARSRKWARA